MTAEARRTLAVIRECLDSDRYALTVHFTRRMAERGLYWADMLAVFDDPTETLSQGMDDYNRPKWIIGGQTATGEEIEIVCAVELDETETVFITLYWQE